MTSVLRALLLCLAGLVLSPSALAQTPDPPEIIWNDSPMSAYYHHGYSVAWLGDVDGDEVDDYAASTAGRSRVEVYSGDSKTSIATLSGGVRHGHSLTSLGDVNGDGVPDFAAGTPFVNGNAGEVRVYSGMDFGVLYTVGGSQAADYFGWGLASVGDTDGDGVPDFLVRSYLNQGTVSLHSGATGAKRFEIIPAGPAEYAGEGLAGVHDFNGDGAADFLVGAPGRGSGEVVLHSGADGAPLAFLTESVTREFGAAVCQLGDLDGDQIPDFAIGAPATTLPGGKTHAGEVFVYSGQSLSHIHRRLGTAQSQRFGELLADGGDYNRDGVADLLVASPGADAGGLQSAGKVELFSGASFLALGSVGGTQQYERMPSSLAGFGDAHHDLHPDYLIGNLAYGNGESGIVRMWGAPSPWLQVDNLVGGQTATLRASDCDGGSTVTFWASLQGFGPSFTPLGLVLLSPPFREIGSASASPSGVAEYSDTVPSALMGTRLYFQAVEVKPGLTIRLSTATGQVIQ
jgi:FG-GAP repeat protein/VCBS repeat protein